MPSLPISMATSRAAIDLVIGGCEGARSLVGVGSLVNTELLAAGLESESEEISYPSRFRFTR